MERVIAICAVISRHRAALEWSMEKLETLWRGGLEVAFPVPFDAADYYRDQMGTGVCKWMVAATEPQDPAGLADWKLMAGAWELEFAELRPGEEPRPLNLDPGYVSQGKLVLATVKDRDHRIYLREGIFAEVTLRYLRSGWTENPWTYLDYRRSETKQFADVCRRRLRDYLIAEDGFRK